MTASVRPLTKHNLDGTPYQRPQEIEQEIGAALGLTPAELAARAHGEGGPPLRDETLVYCLREAHRSGQRWLVEDLWRELVRRCRTGALAALTDDLGADDGLDAFDDIVSDLARRIVEGGDRADFCEVRFAQFLKRRRIDALKRHIAEQQHRAGVRLGEPEWDTDGRGTYIDPADHPTIAPEDWLAAEQALGEMNGVLGDERIRTAYLLKERYGWPVEDSSGGPSISAKFGVTSRTVRTWMRRAEEFLAEWRKRNLK